MAGKTTTRLPISGTEAKVFLDGEEIGLWTSFEATVTINYDDVYIGSDVDQKEVSRQGEGSLSQQIYNSIGPKLFNKLRANKDLRFVIECEITNDQTGGTQNMTIPGVTLNSIPLANWEKGAVVEGELSFRFPPSKVQFTQLID